MTDESGTHYHKYATRSEHNTSPPPVSSCRSPTTATVQRHDRAIIPNARLDTTTSCIALSFVGVWLVLVFCEDRVVMVVLVGLGCLVRGLVFSGWGRLEFAVEAVVVVLRVFFLAVPCRSAARVSRSTVRRAARSCGLRFGGAWIFPVPWTPGFFECAVVIAVSCSASRAARAGGGPGVMERGGLDSNRRVPRRRACLAAAPPGRWRPRRGWRRGRGGGAPDRIRTCGLLLRRQTLYPLSYRGPRPDSTSAGPADRNRAAAPIAVSSVTPRPRRCARRRAA